ncbi:MAG: response regulator [Chloroflexota bacterium]
MSVDPAAGGAPAAVRGPRALVVDDDADLRLMLRRALDRVGFQVAEARDGREALDLAPGFGPDLLVIDLMLPDTHGFELCRQLRAVTDASVILVSAVVDPRIRAEGIEAYADDFVTKPFDIRELGARARRVLGRSREASWPTAAPTVAIRALAVTRQRLLAEALQRVLASAGDIFLVGHTADRDEALELVKLDRPNVLLIDADMRAASGESLLSVVRQRDPSVRVVALLGEDAIADLAAAVDEGVMGCVFTTDSLDNVVDRLRRAARGEMVIPSAVLTRVMEYQREQRAGALRSAVLTARELEILQHLANGLDGEALAETLVVTQHTLRTHVKRILEKLSAHSKLEAVVIGMREGLIEAPVSARTA